MSRRFACAIDELDKGTSKTLEGDPSIAVHRTEDGEFYATADSCSHEQWSLGTDGEIEGDEIVCPLHMARYDLATGKALCLPALVGLATYEVEIEDDKVYVLE